MKFLSIIIALAVMASIAVAQDTNNTPPPQKQGGPRMDQPNRRGPMGPMMQQGERGGPRGPMFRGGRGPQAEKQEMSPNDRPENWEQLLDARRAENLHRLNPSGPYPRGPMGPMFRGGQERPIVIVIQCPCQQQDRQPFQRRHQFRGGRH